MNAADLNDALRLAGRDRREDAQTPLPVLARIEETLQSLPSRGTMRRLAWRRRAGLLAASFILFTLALTLFMPLLPGIAEGLSRLPVIGAAFGGKDKAISVTDHGIKLTIRKVQYDGLILVVDYRIHAKNPIDWQTGTSSFVMKADGLEIVNMSDVLSYYPYGIGALTSANDYEGKFILPMASYRPPEFELELSFRKLTGAFGIWNFKLPVKMDRTIRTVEPDDRASQVYNDEGLLQIGSVQFSPLSTRLKSSYQFSEEAVQKKYLATIQLKDDKGRILRLFTPIGVSDGQSLQLPVYAEAVPKDARQLIIQAVYIDPNYQKNNNAEIRTVMTETPTKAHPLKLPQGEAGYIEISDVTYKANRTIISYRTVGSNPNGQLNFGVFDQDGVYQPWMPEVEEPPGLGARTRTLGPLEKGEPLTFVTRPVEPFLYPGLEKIIDIPR